MELEQAIYRGVENYGAEETNRERINEFRYRFSIDGKETVLRIDNGEKNEDGTYSYPIQNRLKEGYSYRLRIREDMVTAAKELPAREKTVYVPPVSGTPGRRTLRNFLATAMEPVGTTLYVYGGGWNWQDTGSGEQAVTIGAASDWGRFFREQDENYTYRDIDGDSAKKDAAHSYYPYGGYNEYYYAGLDCSGFVGWVIYNTMNTESGQEGYVGSSASMAKSLAERGLGTWTQDMSEGGIGPGDIMSMRGHVWIALGACADGSIVIVHSTPSDSRMGQPGGGVQLGAIGSAKSCEAYRLAEHYMSEFYPDWYERYEVSLKSPERYLAADGDTVGIFRWDVSEKGDGLTDSDGFREMSASEVMETLFK